MRKMNVGGKEVEVVPESDIKDRQVTLDRNTRLRHMLPRTACYGLVIFTLGMTVAMRGPSFLDLQLISGTDVETGSLYFTANAFGYVIGALFTGIIYTRVKVTNMLIIVPMVMSSVLFAVTPWCVHFGSMLAIHAIVAFFWALQETTANTEEVKSWEGNSYSAMQFLSFCYSLGGIVGPLIVEPFLASRALSHTSNFSHTLFHTSNSSHTLFSISNSSHLLFSRSNSSYILFPTSNSSFNHQETLPNGSFTKNISRAANLSEDPMDISTPFVLTPTDWSKSSNNYEFITELKMELENLHNSSVMNNNMSEALNLPSNIHYAYLIAGVIIVVLSVPLCVLHVHTRTTQQKYRPSDKTTEVSHRKLPMKMYIILTGTISMFYFFYTTVDDPYSMYLSIFVVSHLDWSKEDGALVSALYWGCSTAMKLTMVVLVRHINPSVVLFLSCLGMVVNMAVLTVSAHFQVHIMMWICTAIMAISQSAVFGGGFAWADANLIRLDGQVTSCAMIFASLGAMLDPMLLGVTMKELSPMAFPYLLTFQAFMTFAIFLVMLLLFKPYVSQHYGLPRAGQTELVLESSSLYQEEIKQNHFNDHSTV